MLLFSRDALEQADYDLLPELRNLGIYIAMDGVRKYVYCLNFNMVELLN